jgi:heme-degrading monooxygenase HmoA
LSDSKLPCPLNEVRKVAEERAQEFKALEGLYQKYYLQDLTTGEYAGLYLWKSPESLAEFRDSALRASIAAAYQIEGEPRVEVYRVAKRYEKKLPKRPPASDP